MAELPRPLRRLRCLLVADGQMRERWSLVRLPRLLPLRPPVRPPLGEPVRTAVPVEPRYRVAEISGYSGIGGPYSRFATAVWVADDWYCAREVGKIRHGEQGRAICEREAARLNARHRAHLEGE